MKGFNASNKFRSLVSVLLLLLMQTAMASQQPVIVFGILPYLPAEKLVESHEPLRRQLEETLGRKVVMVTAPNFRLFMKRTLQGEYHYTLTAPHLGWLAEKKGVYVHMLSTGHNVQGKFLVNKSSNITNLSQLKGKSVALAAPITVVYQMGIEELDRVGLKENEDIKIQHVKTINRAMFATILETSEASLTGSLLWKNLNKETKDKLRVIGETRLGPGFFFVAHKSRSLQEVQTVKSALLKFNNLPVGRHYFEDTGLKSFVLVNQSSRQSTEEFLKFVN